MTRDEAFATFTKAAVDVLSRPAEEIVREARFAEDLDADSLDLVEFVMALEEQFEVEIPETELEGVTTVGHAFDLVCVKLAI